MLLRLQAATQKSQKRLLPRPGHQVIDQTGKGIAPAGVAEPGGDQPAAHHHRQAGKALFDKADHGKGAQGLAQVIKRETDHGRFGLLDQLGKPPGEIRVEDIGLGTRRSLEQISAVNG